MNPPGLGRLGDVPDTRLGVNAMRHQNSVFHGMLKHIPWGVFDRLFSAHGADIARGCRTNTGSGRRFIPPHFDRTQNGTLAAKRPPSPAQNLADNAREGIDP